MTSHRTTSPRGRLAVTFAVLLAVAALTVGGVAAATPSRSESGTTTARARPVGGASESATFRIVDTGRAIVITGKGRGMRSANTYLSLIYPDGGCASTEATSGTTVDGAWQNHGDTRQTLLAVYDGDAYRQVRGHIGSISIREVTAVTAGASSFTATLTPRACAPVTPTR